MDVSCPECRSKNTQKISTPVADNTTQEKNPAPEVVNLFPEPKLKVDGNPRMGALILTFAVGWIPAVAIYVQTGRLLSALLIFIVTVSLIYVLTKRNVIKNRHYNENDFPLERRYWENGFYCHDCGSVFIPPDTERDSF